MESDLSGTGVLKVTAPGTYAYVTDNSANWNAAYGWGDHAAAGYLTSASNLNASKINSGTLGNAYFDALSDLGGGSGTEFLRKDGTWANAGSAFVSDAERSTGWTSSTTAPAQWAVERAFNNFAIDFSAAGLTSNDNNKVLVASYSSTSGFGYNPLDSHLSNIKALWKLGSYGVSASVGSNNLVNHNGALFTMPGITGNCACLLYTSDAADE